MKLLVPPVILRPTLQGSDTSKSSNPQPKSREVTFFNDFVVFHWFRAICGILLAFTIYFCFSHSIKHILVHAYELDTDISKGIKKFIKHQ